MPESKGGFEEGIILTISYVSAAMQRLDDNGTIGRGRSFAMRVRVALQTLFVSLNAFTVRALRGGREMRFDAPRLYNTQPLIMLCITNYFYETDAGLTEIHSRLTKEIRASLGNMDGPYLPRTP